MRLIDVDALPKLLDAEYKQTMKLIREGEKHLNTLAEGFTEAIHIAKYMPPPWMQCRWCGARIASGGKDIRKENATMANADAFR